MMITSLSGRFLLLTCVFVVLAEILVLVPSVARFREDYLFDRLERSQIASLALLADDMISPDIEEELLRNAEVYNVVLRRDEARQLVLSSPVPQPIYQTYDLREATAPVLIHDALRLLMDGENRVIRVIGSPVRDAGQLIEITMPTQPLRTAMLDYALGVLVLSATISLLTALLLFLSVRVFLMRPIKRVVGHVLSYAESPEDSRRVIEPQAGIRELRDVEEALHTLQTQLTAALRQKERLAQLGGAVAKISHDLRNILTSAQLFTDRLEASEDPAVQRLAPKLVNSITRAVHLCESTLAFGKAEEPAPQLSHIRLADVVGDVIDSERLAVGESDISFAEDIPATLMLRADQEQLYRVISNLVRNARQAIVTSGKPGEIAVAASEDDEAWIIHVTDTGPGLPPKAQEFLFTAFQGGARKGGSGLGLVISAELIRGHGGTLKLDRTGPEGTEFTILLPKGGVDLSDRRA